jgi:hypothetical protein
MADVLLVGRIECPLNGRSLETQKIRPRVDDSVTP